ncbi:hypothetical protein [Stenotrophobium rhamnosiphilum]|uniref:Yip1 domain-containing protein n=1 Tax=Stenotrophobium rhamnosiphilum TaxID=2029166 RepID=A0A2T5MDR6_9GAMM|nr:hypothetical protein [Stenotrophobium rhamnosiphilum]PTU30720.1 hypothetical protein CJD38_14615 [Stenotrophobium rhamnosiphilum]
MFNEVLTPTLRILFFRAGPQDFPYAIGIRPALLLLAATANALVFGQVLPLSMAIGIAVAMIGGMALVVRWTLRLRNLTARFQQTFDSLLATTLLLTLATVIPFSQIAPQLLELTKNPEAMKNAEAIKLPTLPVLLMNLLNFWNFAVTAHIFRHAANVPMWVGFVIGFVAAGVMLFIGVVGGTFVGALFGAPVS